MGLGQAVSHCPAKPTYAIRIWSNFDDSLFRGMFPLRGSANYKSVREYTFDAVSDQEKRLLTPEIARQIITDFGEGRSECGELLVHCSKGESRSPAVAIALNEIFSLGEDMEKLKNVYSEANWRVYETILKEAEKLGLKK